MVTFTAQAAVNFRKMTHLEVLIDPANYISGSITSFTAQDGVSVRGFGSFTNPGFGKPQSGTVTSLEVSNATGDLYKITGMSADFYGLMMALNSGGAEGGLGYILTGNDTINGSNKADVLDGYGGNDTIKGGGGADKLYGGYGDDRLEGGAGKDFLDGGIGSDFALYTEKKKSVSVTLDGNKVVKVKVGKKVEDKIKNIENIDGGKADDKLTGDKFANTLIGNAGNDVLKGRGGFDKLYGGAGKDTLNGGAGPDVLSGGAGNDRLTGGGGNDLFIFNTALNPKTNVDTITDFKPGADRIQLDLKVFSAIDAGEIGALSYFALNKATSASSHIIYKTGSGKLYYDPTGDQVGGDAVLFAKLKPGLALSASDFTFVA